MLGRRLVMKPGILMQPNPSKNAKRGCYSGFAASWAARTRLSAGRDDLRLRGRLLGRILAGMMQPGVEGERRSLIGSSPLCT